MRDGPADRKPIAFKIGFELFHILQSGSGKIVKQFRFLQIFTGIPSTISDNAST